MKELAPGYEERQEFWKPARSSYVKAVPAETNEHTCCKCGGDLVVGALFCHVCGAERYSAFQGSVWRRFPSWRDVASVRDALGHSTASLIALVLGSIFMVAALLTGFIYAATTVLDWQAIQLWRIEWLLAALASFAAGTLLRKSRN
jgi:hypothetical protein